MALSIVRLAAITLRLIDVKENEAIFRIDSASRGDRRPPACEVRILGKTRHRENITLSSGILRNYANGNGTASREVL